MKHLSESVASRRIGKYESSWKTKEGIIEVLTSNGYEEVVALTGLDLVKRSKERGNIPVFCVGDYSADPVSHWIKFYNPDKSREVLFCRELDIIPSINTKKETIVNYATIYKGDWTHFAGFEDFYEFVKTVMDL